MKVQQGTLIASLAAVFTPKGFRVVQASLHKAFCHGRIISGSRGGLSNHSFKAFPKQTLVAQGDSVGILCQHISLVALGTRLVPTLRACARRVWSPL